MPYYTRADGSEGYAAPSVELAQIKPLINQSMEEEDDEPTDEELEEESFKHDYFNSKD